MKRYVFVHHFTNQIWRIDAATKAKALEQLKEYTDTPEDYDLVTTVTKAGK